MTRSLERGGRTVRYLGYVASCMVCGHVWDDATYSQHNAGERARALSATGEPDRFLDGE